MASRYSKLVRDALANNAQGSKQKPISSPWKDPTTLLLRKPHEQQQKAAVNKENDASGRSGRSEHSQGTGKLRDVRHSMDHERVTAHLWEHRGETGDNTPLVPPVHSERSHRTVEEEQRFAEQLQAEKRREARKRKQQEAAEEARREFDFEAHWKKAKELEPERERKRAEEEQMRKEARRRALRERRERQRVEEVRQRAEAEQKYARYQEAQILRARRVTQRRRQLREYKSEHYFSKDKVYASPCHFHCETCWGRCCTGTGCELWGDFDSDCSWALPKACRCDTQQYDVESDSESCYDTDAETGSDADVEETFINYMKLFAAAAGPVSDKTKQEAERLLSLAEAQLKDRKRGPVTYARCEGDDDERDMDSIRDQMVKELKAAVQHQSTLWGMLCALKVIQPPAGTGVPRLAAVQIDRLKRLALAKLHPDKQARASLRDRILAEERFKVINNFVTSS